jgi:hypothetical protein
MARLTLPEPRRRRALPLNVAASMIAAFLTTSVALGAFSSAASSSGMTVATKRIFPGVRSAWPWDVRDASAGGAEANNSDALSYSDGVVKTTGNWSSTFSTTRFDDFDFSSGLPAGIPITSATFNFTFAPSRASDTACFYIDVRRASTNALLGTHGSSGTPSACATSGATVAATVDVSPEVTSSDIANDLRIRVYADVTANKAMKIDLASVSITTPYTTHTLFERRWDDESTGTSTATLWPFVAADGTAYTSAGSFATTFSTTRYIKLTPNESVAASATITNVQLQFGYKSATAGDTTCWYLEVYNGATLIGTHGSSASPVSCNATTAYVTDSVSIPELNTPAAANNVVLKIYMRNSGARTASIDVAQLDVNYYLD